MEKKKHKLFLNCRKDKLSVESFMVLFVTLHCEFDNCKIILVDDNGTVAYKGHTLSNENEEVENNLERNDCVNGIVRNTEQLSMETREDKEATKDVVVKASENKAVFFVPVLDEKLSSFERIGKSSEDYHDVDSVHLPALISADRSLTVIGVSGIIRFLIKDLGKSHPANKLLGFRGGCLSAPADVSIWTKFCEVETVTAFQDIQVGRFPEVFPKLENHLKHPVRTHNVVKKVIDKKGEQLAIVNDKKDKKKRSEKKEAVSKEEKKVSEEKEVVSLKVLQEKAGALLDHKFAEGQELTLSDLVLFSSFHILISYYDWSIVAEAFPTLSHWYLRMKQLCASTANLAVPPEVEIRNNVRVPSVENVSLYTRDPTRGEKKGTDQGQLDEIFKKLSVADFCFNQLDVIMEDDFDWSLLPQEAHPIGGDLPESRADRKCNQLQSVILAVKSIAEPSDVIVDFCSGGGHLGIILAVVLPRCRVVMIENKSESVERARQRVLKLGLKNINLIQGNINYFTGNFSIGVALHACGSATDLVLNACIARRAKFVICPCCYGGVRPTSSIEYPKSKMFKEKLTIGQYLVLAHSGDQTHGEPNKKTEQGFKCMELLDSDRALHAAELGYRVCLTKLKPENCSLKNNLLIGVSN